MIIIIIYKTIISNNEFFNPFSPTILIGWANQNHYELLLQKDINNEDHLIELYILNDNYDKSDKKSINKSNINNQNSEIEDLDKISQNENLNIEYKKILTTFIKKDKSRYPPPKSNKYGDTRLEDIKNYLYRQVIILILKIIRNVGLNV